MKVTGKPSTSVNHNRVVNLALVLSLYLLAGQDRAFRMFSVIQDQQSRELSQGKTAKRAKQLKVEQSELKLPPVTDVAACQVRHCGSSLCQSETSVLDLQNKSCFPHLCLSLLKPQASGKALGSEANVSRVCPYTTMNLKEQRNPSVKVTAGIEISTAKVSCGISGSLNLMVKPEPCCR